MVRKNQRTVTENQEGVKKTTYSIRQPKKHRRNLPSAWSINNFKKKVKIGYTLSAEEFSHATKLKFYHTENHKKLKWLDEH